VNGSGGAGNAPGSGGTGNDGGSAGTVDVNGSGGVGNVSGSGGTGNASGSGGTGGTGNTGGTAGAGGADSGACNPDGTWELQYVSDSACVPAGDTLRVTGALDGSVTVRFVGHEAQSGYCGPPFGGTGGELTLGSYSESGEFSEADCTLTAQRDAEWCRSGEVQCEQVELTLHFLDDTVTGSGTGCRCWCGGVGCTPESLTVTGARSN
jgi:hypothetical protein